MDGKIDLERARRDAKALLRAARTGSAEASARLRPDRAPCLADAQLAVARDLGLASWPDLLRAVESQVQTPLVAAAISGDVRAIVSLLAEGADPDVRNPVTGRAALHEAAAAGDGRSVYALLEGGADPNARDRGGRTALHVAATRGELDVVSVLVTWVPVQRRAVDERGFNALELCLAGSAGATDAAEIGEFLAVAKVLVSNGLTARTESVAAAARPLRDWIERDTGAPSSVPSVDESFDEIACEMDAAWYALLARTGDDVREVGDGFAIRTGLFDNTRNGVVCSHLSDDVAETTIRGVLAFFGEAGVPARWLVRSGATADRLREHLAGFGAEPERTAVYMRANLDDLATSVPPRAHVAISRVHTVGGLADVIAARDPIEDEPEQRAIAEQVDLRIFRREPDAVRRWIAVADDRCVGVATMHIHGPTAELLDLEVAPAERRRGIGRALALQAFADTRVDSGCTTGILSPTAATVAFYGALGFTLRPVPPDRAYYLPLP